MKKKEFTINEHRMELIKKYFPIDEQNKIVTIKIYYEKAQDLLDFSVGELHCELMSNEVLEKITKVTDMVPETYKANILLIVEDYSDYDPKLLMQKLNDLLEINNYQIIKDKRKDLVVSTFLILTGFIIFALLSLEKTYHLLGTGIQQSMLEELADITGTVFIWEAVGMIFLSPSEFAKIGIKFINKIQRVSFLNKEEKVICTETQTEILKGFENESKLSDFRRTLQIISSTGLVILGIYALMALIVSFIPCIIDSTPEALFLNIVALIIVIFESGGLLIEGIAGIFDYRGKRKLNKYLKYLIFVLIALTLARFFVRYSLHQTQYLVTNIFSLIVELAFIFSIFTNRTRK